VKKKAEYTASSGNVFKDLGLPSPDEALAKAELTAKIAEIISGKGLTQAAAAKLLGVDQPKVSALLRGRLSGFSTERLLRFLTALGRDVQIVIRAETKARGPGHLEVVSA
jgi:predicted XRE-type DNA-binding protein